MGPMRRLARIGLLAAAGTGLVALALLAPDLVGFLPKTWRDHPYRWGMVALLILDAIDRLRRPERSERRDEAVSRWLVGVAPAVLAGVAAAGLLSWAPHFLTWPWDRDSDTFSTLAQQWDLGLRPYEDVVAYNFPGHIYLLWAINHLFPPSRRGQAFNAFDVGMVLAIGWLMVARSRRQLGGPIPGWLSYLVYLGFYLGLHASSAGQRDAHVAILSAGSILLAEAWPGRGGLVASAALLAIGSATRPQAVVFLPAIASAIVRGRSWRALLGWAAAYSAFLVVAFSPLFVAGIFDDMIRSLRYVADGGPYSQATTADRLERIAGAARDPRLVVIVVANLALLAIGPRVARGAAATWLLAIVGAVAYRVISPVNHFYLVHPIALIGPIAASAPIASVIHRGAWPATRRALLAGLGFLFIAHDVPQFCLPLASVRAIGPLVRGEMPPDLPSGAQGWFGGANTAGGHYAWADYRSTISGLRRRTRPSTYVADVLIHFPFPPLNGATGRPSPFRAESGICFMRMVRVDIDADFARQLEAVPDSVVVWVPGEWASQKAFSIPKVEAVIRRLYEFDWRSGAIEVWRRKPGT